MEVLKDKYPRTYAWINSLDPFIVIRGDKQMVIKFSDGRTSLELSFDAIEDFETHADRIQPGDSTVS